MAEARDKMAGIETNFLSKSIPTINTRVKKNFLDGTHENKVMNIIKEFFDNFITS